MRIPIVRLGSAGNLLSVGLFAVGLLAYGGPSSAQSIEAPKPVSGAGRWEVYTYAGDLGPFPSKVNPLPGGGVSFDFLATPDRALIMTEHPAYKKTLLGNQTGGTVSATIAISAAAGTTFVHFDDCAGPANVRLHLATASPIPLSPGCTSGSEAEQAAEHAALWWSNPVSIDLATLNNANPVTLSAALEPSQWSDTCGHFGNHDDAHKAAFARAVSQIDRIGLSFGGGCNFAFGDGSVPAGATFMLLSYSVTR